jgi:molecular chaperone HtpG
MQCFVALPCDDRRGLAEECALDLHDTMRRPINSIPSTSIGKAMSNDFAQVKPGEVELVVDLPGLIKIFGDALYSDFSSMVRELVQNAHDGISKALLTAPNDHFSSSPDVDRERIDVLYLPTEQVLVIADSGIGMDKYQLAHDLNNFARSSKGELRNEVDERGSNAALQIIGQYGVGFLAAMATSSQVDVVSKRADTVACTWKYVVGKTTAVVTDAEETALASSRMRYRLTQFETGTVVICKLDERVVAEYYVDEDTIRNGLLRDTRILPIPLYFNGERINPTLPGWADPEHASPDDWAEAIKEMYGYEPLLVIPMFSPSSELSVQGALWIPPRQNIREDSHIDVYVRRMFVMQDAEMVLPNWAKFVCGAINSNSLQRIVSGMTVKSDKDSLALKDFVKQAILDAFTHLRARPDDEYWKVIGAHDDTIKESAADDDEFLNSVWDKLRFLVRQKRLTVPQYLDVVERRTGNKSILYFFDKGPQEFAANLVSDSTGVPILCRCGSAERILLDKISREQNLQLLSFRVLADHLFGPPEADSPLVRAAAASNIAAEVRRFEPSHVPAILIEDKTMQERREDLLRGLKDIGDDPRFLEDLDRLFARDRAANFNVAFYLNASNPLVQAMQDASSESQTAITLALYNISFMAAMPDLKKGEVQAIYSSISSVLTALLAQQKPKQILFDDAETEGDADQPIRLFMIVPFKEAYTAVIDAVREVFEQPPYFFEVIVAKDFMLRAQLLDSLRAHMDAASGFVADITDLNPNVMLELGAALVSSTNRRPVFSLRGSNAAPDVPADIRAELHIPYGSPTDGSAAVALAIRAALERDGKPVHAELLNLLRKRRCRALTATTLGKIPFQFSREQVSAIRQFYPTVEKLMSASREEIAAKSKLKPSSIDMIRAEILDFTAEV